MGAYFQKQLVQDGQKKIVVNNSMLKFMECNHFFNIEAQAVLRYLQARATPENPISVTSVCDYDTEADWLRKGVTDAYISFNFPLRADKELLQEPVFSEFKQHYKTAKASKSLSLTGYLVCPTTKTYINFEWLSVIALAMSEQNKLMVNPLSLLTRRTVGKMGGGDFDFCYDPDYYRYFTTWANKPIYFTDNTPDSDYQDISAYVCFDYTCEPASDFYDEE